MDPVRSRRSSACRNLFGPVDHEQLNRDMELELREMMEEDNRRWNFNFETESPLPGRFEWEEVTADRTTVSYGDHAARNSPKEDAGTDQENRSIVSNKLPAEVTPVRRKRTFSKAAAKPRNNAKITDFFAKRRRTTETKNILNPFHTEAALCKTIR